MSLLKNRMDGNIYPLVNANTEEPSKKVYDTNVVMDLMYCVFNAEKTTTENFVVPLSESHLSISHSR